MALCKTTVTPWSYCSLALSHRDNLVNGACQLMGRSGTWRWNLKWVTVTQIQYKAPYQCSRKTFMVHLTIVRWALCILLKFIKSLIRHLALAIGNVRHVRRFSWTLPYFILVTIIATRVICSIGLMIGCNKMNIISHVSYVNKEFKLFIHFFIVQHKR